MPPRRSTRKVAGPSASPEPAAPRSTRAAVTKRKRANPEPSEVATPELQDEEDSEEEKPRKPSSRARKPASRQPSVPRAKGRQATRKVSATEETIPEESEDVPSPPKRPKKQPLVKAEDDSEDEDEREATPPKARSGASSSSNRTKRTQKKPSSRAIYDSESDDDKDFDDKGSPVEEEPTRKGRATKPSSHIQSSNKAKANNSLSQKSKIKKEVDETETSSLEDLKVSEGGNDDDIKDGTEAESTTKDVSDVENQLTPRPTRTDVAISRDPVASEVESEPQEKSLEETDEEPEQSLLEGEHAKSTLKPRLSTIIPPPVLEEPQGPKSRLVIHKMALVNFKSYAGRQVIGPFHKSFSAIVGPNGSGKSNTIDALLFVFGYRASKMRQGKLSELIHNSANYPDLDECSVEVHFREIIDLPGPDAYEVVPDSQLVVARHAYKNNSSRYTINGRNSTFTEVTTLLKGRGIDLDHKRFLILQGEVESIAQMKPKAPSEHEDGLLEYLEDIIGTSRFKEPIEQALVELDALAEQRAEKLNRLRIVEREKNSLEEKKREAEEFLRLQNELVRAQSRLYQWYLWQHLEAGQQYAEAIDALQKELAEETEKNKDDITHCQMLEKHYKERGELYEEVKKAAAEAMKDLAVHEKQQVNLEELKKHASTKAKKLKKSLQENQKAKDEAIRYIETNTEKMKKEKSKVVEHEASLDEEEKVLEQIRDSLKDKTQIFHDQIEAKQKELQPWTAKIDKKRADVDVAQSERDALAKKVETIKSAHKEAADALSQLQTDLQTKESEKKDVQSSRTSLQKELKMSEKKLQDLQKDVEDLRAKAMSSRQKVEEAKASQAASTSQNRVLDGLTRLRGSGRISGFHGRLGSLGTIPDKYDVAISTACPALNNLIVDTVDQGQACIEYLRKQNLGRASFIVLEKLSQTHGLDKVQTPENVPRLFDLIKPKEPRFAPAFFKAVGNTLVAEDLEQANRIAFGAKRWRVVTLTGQLIDTSGTMSGGGTHVAKGAMSSKLATEAVQPEVLKKYEKESEDMTKRLETAQAQLHEFESQLDGLTKKIPEIDISLQKIDLDIKTGNKRIVEAEKRVRELKSKSRPDEGDLARISTLDNLIAASTSELEQLQGKASVIENAIQGLEKKILDIGGAKLLTQKSKVDGIKLHINIAMEEITKAEVNKAKAEKDADRLQKTIVQDTLSLQEVEKEIENLNEQLEQCTGYVEELQSKVDTAQAAADNAKDDLENLKAELDEKLEQIQGFRQREMEIKQKLNDATKESQDNEKAFDHYRIEHDKLKLEEIDDDEDEEESEVNQVAETESAKQNGEPISEDDPAAPSIKPEPTEDAHPLRKRKAQKDATVLYVYEVAELRRFKKKELLADVALYDEQVKNSNPNLAVLKEYRKREQEFLNRAKDLEQVTNLRDAQKAKYEGLRKQRLDEFMTGFNTISAKLKEMYQMITLGGNAELELVDSMDPFSEGIIFSVMPPKKSWKNISNLSGGEKTLSSLALVFALHVFKPTPLYFMDEIDAALDFRNVSIVANYIKDRTKNAQFIIISLRNDMFELSHRLIGIYKTSNATRSISINNHALTAIPVNALKA